MPLSFDIDETEIDTPALIPAVTQEIVQQRQSPPSVLSFPPGCDPREGDPVYLDIETVPDDESPRARFFPVQPLPPEVAIEKLVTAEAFVAMSVEKATEYIEPITPPQAWVSKCMAAELVREKGPRKGVVSLLEGKRNAVEKYRKDLATEPLTLKIISIGIGVGDCPVRVLTLEQFPGDVIHGVKVEPEAAMLAAAWKIILDKRYTPIIGFGVQRFDLPAMLIRSALLGVITPRMIDLRKYGSSDVIDFEQVIHGGQVQRGFGMKPTAQMLGIDVPESHGDGSKVYQLYKDNNWAAIATYNRGDVEILRAIHERVAGKLCV